MERSELLKFTYFYQSQPPNLFLDYVLLPKWSSTQKFNFKSVSYNFMILAFIAIKNIKGEIIRFLCKTTFPCNRRMNGWITCPAFLFAVRSWTKKKIHNYPNAVCESRLVEL
jgi:hypothetical protein